MLIAIGNTTTNKEVFIPFQEKELSNNHILLNGLSGSGKTYLLQKMIIQAAKQGMSTVVLDYSGSYSFDKLEAFFMEQLQEQMVMVPVYTKGLPINPFYRQSIQIGGQWVPEKIGDTADRVSEIFSKAYRFGSRQRNIFYSVLVDQLEHSQLLTFERIIERLKEIYPKDSEALQGKLLPLAHKKIFCPEPSFCWDSYLYNSGQVTVLELEGFASSIQNIASEIILWDLLFYARRNGNKQRPFIILLDECQHLSFKDSSPTYSILTEGRKFGIGAWLATQSLARFSVEEKACLDQAACKIYFKLSATEIKSLSAQLGQREWKKKLEELKIGQCIVSGYFPICGSLKYGNVLVNIL